MTSRRKRNNRLQPEEKPSATPDGAEPADESAPVDPLMFDSAANAEEPKGESAPKETEFYFPPLKGDGMGDFTPLPGRGKPREPIQLPGPGTSRRRKRPTRPMILRLDAGELGQRFESMAYRAAPTFDFFLFSLLTGVILGLGYLFDAPAVLLLGVVIAPVLTPWVGAMLAAVTGETAFLKQTMGGFLAALLVMVFTTGLLAGFVSRLLPSIATTQLQLHAQLSLFDLLLVAAGTVALTLAFVQSEEKPLLPSLLVAYTLYLPASAAGFGMGGGIENIGVQALMVLLAHLAISAVVALLVFYYMGFRPLETTGYVVLGLIALGSLALTVAIFAWGTNPRGGPTFGTPVGPNVTAATLVRPTATSVPTTTPTPTKRQFTPTASLTAGPTAIPTPIYGRIGKRGVYLQDEPGGTAITTLDSGYLVEFLPDSPSVLEGTTWVRVLAKTPNRDLVGWVRLDFILTATPSSATQVAPATRTPTSTRTLTLTIGPSPTATATYEATGSYAVVNINKFDAALNVRTAPGVTNPLAGSLAYTLTDIGKLGPPEMVGSAEWWQIRKAGGVTGWVNSIYLTEYIPSEAFCADERVKTLLTDFGTAVKNADGAALTALVSPKHGLDVRLITTNNAVNYPKDDVGTIFTSSTVQNWGTGLGSDATKISGTFADTIQPKLLEVYNTNYELTCNDTSKIVGPANLTTWPSAYATINFYSLYKPAAAADAKDWRNLLIGIEYVDAKPYLFSVVNFQQVP